MSAQVEGLVDSLYQMKTGQALFHKVDSNLRNNADPEASALHYFYPSLLANHQFTYTNATQLVADSLQQSGWVQPRYRLEDGDFHLSQYPRQQQTAYFYTEGLYKLGRVKVSGHFRLQKQWMNSWANNLAMLEKRLFPYYYFTPTAETYEGQHYDMGATITYGLISEKLYLGPHTHYQYHWLNGSVDSHISSHGMQLFLYPSMTYRLGSAFIGLSYIGYGHEDLDILYNSLELNYSILYPERFYYLNMGYGNIALKYQMITERDMER